MALHHQMFLIMIMLLCGHIPHESKPCNIHHQTDHNTITASLETLNLDGYFEFDDWNTALAARDFGNRFHFPPLGVLHPKSVFDIATTVRHVFHTGGLGDVTVAARGHGHSLQGQAQAHGGIVINMESLNPWPMRIIVRKGEYDDYVVEVSGGELWIDVLRETLKYGLAPNSWTDYLHLTVGGTLSNGGISGQAFRHGPQINNVHHLEVVTGKGDVMNCSEKENPELFFGVLGGLAQFGIITRATITLEPAPSMVKWIRVLYSDFSKFSRDQELLISMEQTFNYIEGFVVINSTGLLNNWRSSFHPKDPVHATQFISDAKTLYCLEVAKYYNPNNDETEVTDMQIQELLSQLSYIPSTLFLSQVPYLDFLDRVHVSELKLRAKGMWDVPHPWLSLLIPRSKMVDFANEVFVNVLKGSSNGPILIYPLNQSMWNTVSRTSLITPEEHVFYHVTFLASAVPSSTGRNGLEHILARNQRILDFCSAAGLGVKRYLPHYTIQEEWKNHFGSKWEVFLRRKLAYDPLAILAPGHRIFKRESQIHQQIITEELLRQT